MSSVCEELHKFHLLSLKKSLRDIDIPPRRLLARRSSSASHDGASDMFSDDSLLLHKYLPRNKTTEYSDDDDDDDSGGDSNDPYSSDHFRMYEFKVRRCTRSRSHDWTDCPFAHPGEKARRRDPRRYHYSGTVCPEYRRDGACRRGDACEFSHGVFECWLHPARYRTEACKDGKSCKRKVCFFAHTPRQLRVLPLNLNNNSHVPQNDAVSCCGNNHSKSKFFNSRKGSGSNSNSNHFCLFCHCCNCSPPPSNSNCSPTSTLFGVSHFSSPPMSPSSPASIGGVNHRRHRGGGGGVNVSYKDVLNEIMCSIEGLNLAEASSSSSSFGCEDRKQRFNNILSPTVVGPSFSAGYSMSGNHLGEDDERNNKVVADDVIGTSCPTPDLGWVHDLLM